MSDELELEFQVGSKAVVPNQGVGVIKELEAAEINGTKVTFYVIKLLDNGGTYRCPVGMAAPNNVRDVMPIELVDQVYEVLADREKPADKQTWNRRYREYTKKITTNDPLQVAAVLRDLAVLRLGKTLSFGERKMYDRAHGLIVQEIAAVRDVDEEIIKTEIEELFAKADAEAQQKAKTKKKK
ncbi:MAG: CarD family transcriptional regulator [Alphaproteobacteria bacterium]|nr:CarD family transcriptional regulator [Alphaproteobacteria bacterium]